MMISNLFWTKIDNAVDFFGVESGGREALDAESKCQKEWKGKGFLKQSQWEC